MGTERSSNTWGERLNTGAAKIMADMIECATDELGEVGQYGSEIEIAIAKAMIVLTKCRYPELMFDGAEEYASVGRIDEQLMDWNRHRTWGIIVPQFKIASYRVDFVVRYYYGISGAAGLVVECDGHEFHEKTKTQAARDKARDRDLVAAGYQVMRFTGSEIWRDPFRCADAVLGLVLGRACDSLAARYFNEHGNAHAMERHLAYAANGGYA